MSPTDEEIELWNEMWQDAWTDAMNRGETDPRSTVHAFAIRLRDHVRDHTRRLLEENPPPVSDVQQAVGVIAGLVHALRVQTVAISNGETYDEQLADPIWITAQIALALSKIRTLLRDAQQREMIVSMAEDRDPKPHTPLDVPVTTRPKSMTAPHVVQITGTPRRSS